MSALTIPQIPTNIDTVEKLVVWATKLLSDLNPNLEIITALNISQRVASWALYRDLDGNEIAYSICIIKMDSNYATGSLKLWEYAKPLSNVILPNGFLSN
jgi:hypothetical protein